jgi:broad specificity phosphatase PhoE
MINRIVLGLVVSLISVSFACAQSASSLPRVVYLMRHADKPDAAGDPHLSPAGVARAARLPGYFPGLLGGQKLDTIFATSASKASNRPVETAAPLAASLHLPLNQSYGNSSYSALAGAIRSGSYAGKTILVVWHHGTMPALAQALGASPPGKWPGSSFGMIWKVTYNANGNASLQQIHEPF